MRTLGASIAIRNATVYDFCLKECVLSILPICQEIIIAESDSEDDTLEIVTQLAREHPKIKVVNYPYRYPRGDFMWVMNWTNFAREHLRTDYNLQMDADEVVHEDSLQKIVSRVQSEKELSLRCRRYNFWSDHNHLIPHGVCCADEVIRVAPTRMWLAADLPVPQGQAAMNIEQPALDIEIFHYGFLRRRDAFFKKEKHLQIAFSNEYDPRLAAAETTNDNWMARHGINDWAHRLDEFKGTHPEVIKPWLRERNYVV